MTDTIYHTAILGAGASGLFCAGSFSQSKIIIDHNPAPGLKINVSGGGNCNFTNLTVNASNYLSQNKHFCKSALSAFTPQHFLQLLEDNGLKWQEKEHGRLFGFNAKNITSWLVRRAKENNTQFLLSTQLLDVKEENGLFHICTSNGPIYAYNLVVATGGLSYPALGASGFAYKVAQKFGLQLVEQKPVLAGLRAERILREQLKTLAGNSLPVRIQTGSFEIADDLLFTHDGISGPAALQTSLFWQEGTPISIHFLPATDWNYFFKNHKNSPRSFSTLATQEKLPLRIAKVLLGTSDRDAANASKEQLEHAILALTKFTFYPVGTSGYTKAEATAGGVDTRELNPATLQSRQKPSLFFTGEALDVTGMLGGYNLQWAWSSGYAAAQALARR